MVKAQSRSGYSWLWTATTSDALAEGISWSFLPLIMSTLTRDPYSLPSSKRPPLCHGRCSACRRAHWPTDGIEVGSSSSPMSHAQPYRPHSA
jgi:hypothetical protein